MRAEDKVLIQAHDALLDRVVAFLRTVEVTYESPGDAIVWGLALRVLQLAHALQSLLESGYASVAAATARAILSGAVSLVAICDADKDGRAHAFAKSAEMSTARASGIADALGLQGSERTTFLEQAATKVATSAFVRAGIEPRRVADRRDDTWHGTTDRDLFEKMGMGSWYELFYRTLSDESHVNARAIGNELRELMAGDIGFGSKYAPSWEVLLPTGKCVVEVLGQLDVVFGWNRQEEVRALGQPFETALNDYARAGAATPGPIMASR